MPLSTKAYIRSLRNFRNTTSTISLEQLAKHCEKQRRPISLRNLITGSCAGEATTPTPTGSLPPLRKDPGSPILYDVIEYLPDYIKLSSTPELTVSFYSGAFKEITIPRAWFPNVITDPETGKQYFPSNFCGFRIKGAISYQWSDYNNEILDSPFGNGSVPNDLDLVFTGPIGKCRNGGADFFFDEPMLYGGGILPNRERHYMLQIKDAISIELLQSLQEVMPMKEIYSIDVQKELKKYVKMFPDFFDTKLVVQTLHEEGYPIDAIVDFVDLPLDVVLDYIFQ